MMLRAVMTEHRPGPQVAYAPWMQACALAGWQAVPAAEQVPVQEGLGRVAAEQVCGHPPAGPALALRRHGRHRIQCEHVRWRCRGRRPVGAPGRLIPNSVLLAARATEQGARPVLSEVQPDDTVAITAEVRRAALTADLVLIIAGVSTSRR